MTKVLPDYERHVLIGLGQMEGIIRPGTLFPDPVSDTETATRIGSEILVIKLRRFSIRLDLYVFCVPE